MLMISSRDNFWESEELSDYDEIRDVVLTDESLGTQVSESKFLQDIADKTVLLIIHGYNNEEDDVVRAYRIIENNIHGHMPGFYDLIVGYTWPGGDDGLDYFAAKRRAGTVAPRVGRWLQKMVGVSRAIDVMSHSMGGRVILSALEDVTSFRVRNLFNMASAVDNESIQVDEPYYDASRACETLYVFHSKNDPVLKTAYLLAEWDRALGYSGPEDPADIIVHSPHVRVINCERVIQSHGGYKRSRGVYNYIKNELSGAQAPQFTTLR